MNYQQTYDPMQASAMRQQQNLGLAQSIKGGLSAVQQGLQEHAVYKKYVAKNKNLTEQKAKFLNAVTSYMQENGQDPSKVPELTSAQNDVANEDVPFATFAETVTKVYDNAKATTGAQAEIAAQPPEVRGFRQPQPGAVGAIDPMAQPQQPGGKVDDFTARLLDEQKTGAYNPTVNAVTEPFKVDDPTADDEDPFLSMSKKTTKYYNDLMAKGLLKPADAKEFHDQLGRIEELKLKERIEDKKLQAANAREDKMVKGKTLAESYKAGYQPTKEGEVQNEWTPSIFDEPDRWGVGPIDPSMDKDHPSRTGGGSGIKKDTDLAALFEKFHNNSIGFYSEGELKHPSLEGAAKQAAQRARIVGNALTIQSKVGSDILDSKTAVQKAEEFVSIKDALKSVIGDQEGLWNKENPNYPEWKSMFLPNDTPSVLKNADRLFNNLKISNPGAYNKIVLGLQNGNSLYTILNAIEAQGIE